jgi:quercetin dioxygenase-like cupin family protein
MPYACLRIRRGRQVLYKLRHGTAVGVDPSRTGATAMIKLFHSHAIAAAVAAITVSAAPAMAQTAGKATFVPVSQVAWTNAGIPGVQTAVVRGDMKSGPSHFYLKYAAGFAAPLHHHSPDHFATTVAGNLVLIADGKERAMPPGSYFAFAGKAQHAARCEGAQDCVMFIDARGPWDVVAEKH